MRQIRNGAWRDAFFLLLSVVVVAPAQLSIVIASAAAQSEPGVFAVPPPSGDPAADLTAIQAALAKAKAWQAMQPKGADGLSAKVEVVLAPGTYDLCPDGGTPAAWGAGKFCLRLNGWENLAFRGTHGETTIMLLNPDQGYAETYRSRHITIADLTLDMQTPPFTQGKVAAVHTNGRALASIDVQLDNGFPTFADSIYQQKTGFDDDFLVIMDPSAPRPKAGVPDYMHVSHNPSPRAPGVFEYAALLADGKTWRLAFDGQHSPPWQFADRARPPIAPGDRFVFVARLSSSALTVTFSDTVTITGVTVRAASSFAVGFVQNSGALVLDHVEVAVAPGSRRLVSTTADGAHFQNNRGPVTIQYSRFQGMTDDAITIYSLATSVHQVLAAGANGRIIAYSPRLMLAGDQLQIVDPANGAVRGKATVIGIKGQQCPPQVTGNCYAVTVDRLPADTKANDVAFIYNAAGGGASIHHNVIGAHRGYGILLNSPNSIVADNQFTDAPKDAVVIGQYHATFAAGQGGPIPDHILVRHNVFSNGAPYGGRSLWIVNAIRKAGAPGGQASAIEGPSDIAISDNTFQGMANPTIEVAVGQRIELANNKVARGPSTIRKPAPVVQLSAGSGFLVNGLVVDEAIGATAAVEIGCGVRATDPSRWTIQSGQLPRLLDRRPQCR